MKKIIITLFALLLITFATNQNLTFAHDNEYIYEPDASKPNQKF